MQITYDEEYWGLGSQYWSKNPHEYGYSASFGILLDMVGAKMLSSVENIILIAKRDL